MPFTRNTLGIARIVKAGPDGIGEIHVGMAIITDARHVLTCCHVLNDALDRKDRLDHEQPPTASRFSIRYPYANNSVGTGFVVQWGFALPQAWDVAVLQLDNDAPADAGLAAFSDVDITMEKWSSIGWDAHAVDRQVQGEIGTTLATGRKQLNGISGRAPQITRGYSGSGVWSDKANAFVGMVDNIDGDQAETGIAYALPTSVLLDVWPHLKRYQYTAAETTMAPTGFARDVIVSAATTFFVLGVYLSSILILQNSWTALNDFRAGLGNFWFAVLFILPIVGILPSSVLFVQRQLRERRLSKTRITEHAVKPGLFRLQPYNARDADDFFRADAADAKVHDWVRAASGSLLWLSGSSGVGKSSLIAASLIPKLQAEGWRCIVLRVDRDPSNQIAEALHGLLEAFGGSPSADVSTDELVRAAAAEALRTQRPLLVVIDQFEEFLILNEDAARAPITSLLNALAESPLPGFKLLCAYRSDYAPLIFDLDLPEPHWNQTLFEMLPFRRDAAEDLFGRGGFSLTDGALNGLFRGLDRLEGTPGLYRPITLNMVGLVLLRMGRQVSEDPERLIERYLRQCVTEGDARDYAPTVLNLLITNAGTKEPREVVEIVDASGLPQPRVRHALVALEGDGLVRRLDESGNRWEVSHDFLARTLAHMLGRLRPARQIFLVQSFMATCILLTAITFTYTKFYLPNRNIALISAELNRAGIMYWVDDEIGYVKDMNNQNWTDYKLNLLSRYAPTINVRGIAFGI
jgi:hypothetical protein